MIAMLAGRVDSVGDDWAVLDVQGVGYLVFCSTRTLSALPPPGEAARLEIVTHVREDHIHLYGFGAAREREWFRLLTTVQGVGARVALAILSVLGPDDLAQAIAVQDRHAVARANGVGPKLAGRIVAELKDKAGAIAFTGAGLVSADGIVAAGADEEAVSALVNLGFSRTDAAGAVIRASHQLGGQAAVAELIRAGLRELSQ